NAEIALDGAVDPYFKGFANIVLKLDKNNETEIELEETYFQSTSLPGNLQVKAGQFFANFGRQNSQHPHQWAFVDAPIILTRAFGPEGLRSIAGQVSWLLPTPFYTEASLGILDGQGGTSFSFRNVGENDGTGIDRCTQIYGTDIYWKWKPANAHSGFPFVAWQTEALYQRFEAGADPGAALPAETLEDWGFYSQVLWGFRERWVAALR